MRSLYNFLKELNHLEDWHVVKGEETLYPRTEYSQIEIDTLSYNNIVNYLEELSKTTKNIYSFSTKRAKKSLAWIRKINWKKRRRSSSTEHFVAVYSLHCTSYQMDKLLCVNSYIGINDLLLEMLNPIASWKFGIQKKLSLFMRLSKRISLKILCVTAVVSSKSVGHLDKYAIEQ